MTSLCAIIPAANLQAANTTLAAAGFGPGNFSVASFTGAIATHAALHAWHDPVFSAAVKALAGVVWEESEGDPVTRTKALIEAQGAQWGTNAPELPDGPVTANTLYRYEGGLWWVIQPHDRSVYGGDPAQYPALVRRAREPGKALPWVQPLDALNAYRLLDPFTGKPEVYTHNGKEWFVSQGDGSGNNIWEPGTFGWTEQGQTPVIQPEPQPGPQAWAIGQSVVVGDLRSHNGKVWKAKVAHVTHAGWEPSAAAWAVWEEQV